MFDVPPGIRSLIGAEKYSVDNVGMSHSTVVLFDDKILKIQNIGEESDNEYRMMKWLRGRLPVPKVLGFDRDDNKSYLLMKGVPGERSCSDRYMRDPEKLTAMLAEGLQMLWDVDVGGCPCRWNLDKKLRIAEHAVKNHLVNADEAEPDTFGANGFQNPEHLLEWLIKNKPEEETVLSHGDFCLPNIFLNEGRVSGFIDLGMTGTADKWQDIALCYRSLLHNFGGKSTGRKYPGFSENMLFDRLGIKPDWDRLRYYILLDELY